MNFSSAANCGRVKALALLLILSGTLLLAGGAQAQITIVKLSTDTFTNTSSQHATEVEPDTFSFGSTMVTAFQVGRISTGGSADIGFATSTDGGTTFTNGFLPGLTVNYQGGPYQAASDPSVAFDSKHGVWMINSLGLTSTNIVLVSRSTDALNWNNPVTVNNSNSFADKNWIVCDNTSTSAFFGNCYVEWDDAGLGDQMKMATSSDGGLTWKSVTTSNFGLGGQPIVLPNGTVVVPFEGNGIQAFTSTNGGTTWGKAVTVSTISEHGVAGGLRTSPLPSAEIDSVGTLYVAWQDCRFRTSCKNNDIVFSTSTDGVTWSAVSRVPIDPTTSTVDHFIPGLGVDHSTGGSTAHLGLTYYYYQNASCTQSTCKMAVGFISSQDGGTTWSAPIRVTSPMQLSWLPSTTSGLMVGDYISTSYVSGKGFGVFAKANKKSGSVFDEAMYTPLNGLDQLALEVGPHYSSAADKAIPGAKSDHGPSPCLDHECRLLKPGAQPPVLSEDPDLD
jgi:hypothetical protein